MKAKWRNLRDTYKKFKQCQQTSSGQAAKKLANWVWADQMSFIDSSINLRQTHSTLNTSEIRLDTSTSGISPENENENSTEPEQVPNNEQNELHNIRDSEINPRREEISRRRRRNNNDPADKIINYLKTRKTGLSSINGAENLVKVTCDRMDMEFLGYANTVKTLPLQKQAIIKLQITNIITQAQLQELNNSRPNSASTNASSSNTDDSYYIDSTNVSTQSSFTEQPSIFTDIAQIHSINSETHSVPIIINTDTQNLSTTAQIHAPNTQMHSVPIFINTDTQNLSTTTQIHTPSTQLHSSHTPITKTQTQNIDNIKKIQYYVSNWNEK